LPVLGEKTFEKAAAVAVEEAVETAPASAEAGADTKVGMVEVQVSAANKGGDDGGGEDVTPGPPVGGRRGTEGKGGEYGSQSVVKSEGMACGVPAAAEDAAPVIHESTMQESGCCVLQ
jgi:hypothetical protein